MSDDLQQILKMGKKGKSSKHYMPRTKIIDIPREPSSTRTMTAEFYTRVLETDWPPILGRSSSVMEAADFH